MAHDDPNAADSHRAHHHAHGVARLGHLDPRDLDPPEDSVAAHRAESQTAVSTYLVTCSDTRDAVTDANGAALRRLLEAAGHVVTGSVVVRDDAAAIREALERALEAGARAVLFNGGTGLAPRDVTLETLAPLFEKAIPGFGELFRMLSFEQVGSAAMLSRAGAGVVRGAVVFALPGSPKAVTLAMERLILPELGHLVREVLRPGTP